MEVTASVWLIFVYTRKTIMAIQGTPKRRGRPATGLAPQLGFRAHKSFVVEIDKAIEKLPNPKPTRSEFIRRIVQEWIEANK
jgi:hypothetical protein